MIQAVIFDVDGTLIDSVDLHARAWQDALRDFGHDVPYVTIRDQIGKGGDQLIPVFLSPEEMEEKQKPLEKHRSTIMKERYTPLIRPFSCVPDLFRRIRADGTRVILASSAKKEELQVFKRIAGIEDLVDGETTSDDSERSKPHPDIFDAAFALCGTEDKTQVVTVGDTPYDAKAAAKAGLRPIGVRSGGWADEPLRAAGCIAVYAGPSDLLLRYEETPLAGRS
ncbi:HAD family hydrolase [Pararoseomonas indoligenes]|uniref:HAD family hydrolase n=1 Tax=Roseomonas indoligenes TaxID=2820811 RepID=A0A940MZ11_9PROT|nr:HAD family hydrolase [Pararoseomonas indoligenes]MBP0493680.1 HAD family hydrolase [Pararoseomonas indoligenes]